MKLPTKASPSDSLLILETRQAVIGVQYKTLSNPSIRVIFKGFNTKDGCTLEAFDPAYQEWRIVQVPKDYKLKTLKEGEAMPKTVAAKLAKSKNSVKAAGEVSGKSVYQTWGEAFTKFGTNPKAVELIVKHMQTNFPGRKTDWKKWVNSVRTLYNRGDAKLGAVKPTTPLKPYAMNGAAKPASKPASKPKAFGAAVA